MSVVERTYQKYIGRPMHDELKKARANIRQDYQDGKATAKFSSNREAAGLAMFVSSGGDPRDYSNFRDLVAKAVRHNYTAHDTDIDPKARQEAFNLKDESLMEILSYRKNGLGCISIGLEYSSSQPENSKTYVSIRVDLARTKAFHIPYPHFLTLCQENSIKDPLDLIGKWDFELIGLRLPKHGYPAK